MWRILSWGTERLLLSRPGYTFGQVTAILLPVASSIRSCYIQSDEDATFSRALEWSRSIMESEIPLNEQPSWVRSQAAKQAASGAGNESFDQVERPFVPLGGPTPLPAEEPETAGVRAADEPEHSHSKGGRHHKTKHHTDRGVWSVIMVIAGLALLGSKLGWADSSHRWEQMYFPWWLIFFVWPAFGWIKGMVHQIDPVVVRAGAIFLGLYLWGGPAILAYLLPLALIGFGIYLILKRSQYLSA